MLLALTHPTNLAASLEFRVRSYLSANCVQCHQPGGAGPQQANWDARITTPLAAQGIVDGLLVNSFGNASNRVVKAGSLTNSILYYRVAALGPDHMPPLATSLVNTQAVQLLSDWINIGLMQQPPNSLLNPILTNNLFQFTLAGTPGAYYEIQAATNLNGPWLTVATNQADPSTGLSTFTDPNYNDYSSRYYRTRLAP